MLGIRHYHRPESIEEALRLLARPGIKTVALAGGTSLLAGSKLEVDDLVDLQAVGLNQVELNSGAIMVGAMVRLQQIVDSPEIPPLVREMAKREGPNTFRNAGTLGGVVFEANWESELYASLLVHEAAVRVQTMDGTTDVPLEKFTKESLSGGLATSIIIIPGGRTANGRVVRTPADAPIVAVIGRQDDSGRIRLAICGVADRPVLVSEDLVDEVEPPADFRGSSAYRRQIAKVLSERVLAQLAG